MRHPMTKLGDFCKTGSGGTPSRTQMDRYYENGDIPWVKSGELRESLITSTEEHVTDAALTESSIKLVPAGAILLAMYGATVGRLAILGVEATTNQAVCHIVPDANVADTRYLYHAISAQVPSIVEMGVGGAQPNISQGLIKELKVLLPPLPEQRRIAAILDQADVLRAKRREALAQLDSLTQSIFIEMFGKPSYENSDWPEVTLADVTETLTGFAFRSAEYIDEQPGAIRLCRGTNVLPGRIDWSDTAWWPAEKAGGLESFRLVAGDIVLAMDRPWISEGFKLAQISHKHCPSFLVQRVTRIRGSRLAEPKFIFQLLKQPEFTRHCKPTETTVPHISPKEIRSYKFGLPPFDIQTQFRRKISTIEALSAKSGAALDEADALFASLQYRAFRGEL